LLTPRLITNNNKWWIEVNSKRVGHCYLLDPKFQGISVPVQFETEKDALDYIETLDKSKYE
jgi:hypothetical protein